MTDLADVARGAARACCMPTRLAAYTLTQHAQAGSDHVLAICRLVALCYQRKLVPALPSACVRGSSATCPHVACWPPAGVARRRQPRVHVAPQIQRPDAFLVPVSAAIHVVMGQTQTQTQPLAPELAALLADASNLVADDDAYANKFGKAGGLNRNDAIHNAIVRVAQQHQLAQALVDAVPTKYEFISDVLLVARVCIHV